jgi:hypothetical protein
MDIFLGCRYSTSAPLFRSQFFGDDTQMMDEDSFDDDFELGDGTAETEATVSCPYCGEEVEIALDPGSGGAQEYVEDCAVCCKPWSVSVSYDVEGKAEVSVTALDE